MSQKNVIFSLKMKCWLCDCERHFFGDDKSGDFRQAKINASVAAAEAGWYVDYDPKGNLCPECKAIPENEDLMDHI